MRLPKGPGRRLSRSALVVALCASPAWVRADPLVDEAASHIERAEFDAALSAIERAEAAGNLSRRDVLRVLELRALVHLALRRRPDAERDLEELAALAPAHRFAPHTSPDLVTAFELARRNAGPPPRLVVERDLAKTTLTLRARVEDNERGLVRSVGLQVRVNGKPWSYSEGPLLRVPVSPGDRVEYAAQGRGGRGVVLVSDVQTVLVPAKARSPESRTSPAWYVAGGAAAAVAVIVGIVLAGSGAERTQPSRPTLEER